MPTWETAYKGHRIRVENGVTGEKLFIDDALATRDANLFSASLRGVIPDGEGQGEEIVAELRSGMLGVGCRVLANGVELFRYSVWSPLRPLWRQH